MEGSTVPPSYDEIVCPQVAANIYASIIHYLSIAISMPLHVLIVLLLLARVAKRRFYHFLIIAQSVMDIAHLTCLFVTHTLCITFKKYLHNHLYPWTAPIQLVLTVFLMIHWKSAIRPQKFLDAFLYTIAALTTVEVLADKIFKEENVEPTELALPITIVNTVANVVLTFVCFAAFYLVIRMDVSRFSEVTVQGQKKMTIILFLQFVFVFTENIFDTLTSYANYVILTDPYVIDANARVKNGTDLAELQEYLPEYKEHLKLPAKIFETFEIVTSFWETFLPFARGVLICWAIRPLLQKKKPASECKTTTEM